MKFQLATLALMLAVASADVSHLNSRYLPPQNYHMPNNQQGMMMMMHHQQQNHPSNERVETTIEQHQVVELPTQIEIVKDGQPIYGVQRQPIVMARTSKNFNDNNMNMMMERMPEINSRYLPPQSQEIQNLQPPQQVPYEMPAREYLPPVDEITTTEMPTTTTMLPPTTTYNPYDGETTTEQQLNQEELNNYVMTTTEQMPTTQEPAAAAGAETAYETTTTMPENHYLPPTMPTQPQNHYLPPMNMMMTMLPPPEPMPQPTYQQYQEQMLHEQQMQQMYREQEMQEMMNAIAEMEQQQMIAVEQQQQQMQPVAPVEPAHILREDGYHYQTAETGDVARRFRYRH